MFARTRAQMFAHTRAQMFAHTGSQTIFKKYTMLYNYLEKSYMEIFTRNNEINIVKIFNFIGFLIQGYPQRMRL